MASGTVDYCSVSWKTPNRDGAESTRFTIRNMTCCMYFCNGRNHECDYRLYLCRVVEPVPDKPIDVLVEVIIGTNVVSHCRTTYVGKTKAAVPVNIIWKGHASELSKVIADFDQQDLLFKVTALPDNELRTAADKSVQTPTYLDSQFELDNLSRDFSKLLEDGGSSHPDVELVCGDSTFKAHGSLLSVRSDVFRTMLQTDMLEAKTGRVEIQNADPDIFREFLQYLYSGKLPELTVDTAVQYYEMGDRYSVAGLKERCSSFLMDNLARSNACTLLGLADRHSDHQFRQFVISYIVNEKIPLHNEYWSDFRDSFPRLAFEIYDKFLSVHFSK